MSGLQEGGAGKESGKAPRRWLRWPVLRSVVLLCLLRLCAVFLMGCQPAQSTCTDERDCMGNQYCAEGVCRNTCETAVDCLGNEECNTQGKCVTKGTQRAADAGETTASDAGGTPEQTGGTGQEAIGPDAPGPDAPRKPSCTGFPLRQNSRFDVDLKAIVLSGRVTVNGKTMPALPFGRGKLVFRHHKGGTASSLSFGREGEARYQVKLFPGVYDISYQPDSTCSPKESTIPCLSYPLATGKQLMQSGSLSFDLPVVELSGRMTLSGKTMPSSVSSYRGGLSFQLAGGGSVGTGSFAKSGDIRFRVRLFAGTYGIRYVPSSSCDRERDPLPCQSLSVRSGLVIKQNST